MNNEISKLVNNLLGQDTSGHGMDHINRVLALSIKFAKIENADLERTSLIALLHDVDDYKLFENKNSDDLPNARKIMTKCGISKIVQDEVCNEISRIGYHNTLKGIRPITLEGMIVSDADMCDAIGANGILRTYAYNNKVGRPFFDKDSFPNIEMNCSEYVRKDTGSSVNHMFEKLLKLKGLMLTSSGKNEALNRHNLLVAFLYQYFDEESVPNWTNYLNDYLKKYCN